MADHSADVGECDNCGLERLLVPCRTPHGEGSFCAECRHNEDLDEIEEDGHA